MIAFAQLQGVSLYLSPVLIMISLDNRNFSVFFLRSVGNAREGAIDPKNYLIRP